MNKLKVFLIAIIIIIICTFVLYGVRTGTSRGSIEITVSDTLITSTSTAYVSSDGQIIAVSYNSNNSATLTIPNTEYQNTILESVISASGAQYENPELKLVLWEKVPDITITQDEKVIFEGKIFEAVEANTLTESIWVWKETYNGVGPEADVDNPITPNKADTFTLTFAKDGRVSGTTDCNNFSGIYKFENGVIHFDSFMSTLMYCEGSQEKEFISMLKDAQVSMDTDGILFEHDQTIVFQKQKDNI